MGERSVHEAAVDAVAGALAAHYPDVVARANARVALAALVASAEVRKGLVAAATARPLVCSPRGVDVILAALAGKGDQ